MAKDRIITVHVSLVPHPCPSEAIDLFARLLLEGYLKNIEVEKEKHTSRISEKIITEAIETNVVDNLSQATQDKTEIAANELPATLTVNDVAAYLGISKTTVDRRISSGELKSYKNGRLQRIKREALLEYMATLERAGGLDGKQQ